MQVRHNRLFGEYVDSQVELSVDEQQALRRAYDIVEEARDHLREAMGNEEFEYSTLYALDLDDLVGLSRLTFSVDVEPLPEWVKA